jgi:hypothetical protein
MPKTAIPNRRKPPAHEKEPDMKWQTGAYARESKFQFILPYQFLLLCRLMDVTPAEVLTDFMDNLSCGSWKREGRDTAKQRLVEYFIEHGYGQHRYSTGDITAIFREMDAIGLLWPVEAKMKLIDLTSEWREKYHKYWFKKWFRKPRRKLD